MSESVILPDLSRVYKSMLLENQIVGVGFLEGYVFLRCLSREVTYSIYDPNQEITGTNLVNIAGRTFIPAQKFGSTTLNVPDQFLVTNNYHAYQFWLGVSPSATRVFPNVNSTNERNLDVADWGTNTDYRFGFIDGFTSPLLAPSPESEQWSTPNITYQWGIYNGYNTLISPLFSFIINRLNVGVIKDAGVLGRILSGAQPSKLVQIGGLNPPKFNMKQQWGVLPVQLNASQQVIQAALAVGAKS